MMSSTSQAAIASRRIDRTTHRARSGAGGRAPLGWEARVIAPLPRPLVARVVRALMASRPPAPLDGMLWAPPKAARRAYRAGQVLRITEQRSSPCPSCVARVGAGPAPLGKGVPPPPPPGRTTGAAPAPGRGGQAQGAAGA